MMENTTSTHNISTDNGDGNHNEDNVTLFKTHFALYIGVSIGAGIVLCAIVIIFILLYKKGKLRPLTNNRRPSMKRLFIRGFSTISQRGVIDSTDEFEMVNPNAYPSVSSDDGGREPRLSTSSARNIPRKPDRRRTRTSSSNVKYENVTLDPNAGFIVRKSASMNSCIPYIDETLERHLEDKDEELDDVFT